MAACFGTKLSLPQRIPLFDQPVQLFALLRDAVGIACLVGRPGRCGRLFCQLAKIVPQDRDPVVELWAREGALIGHGVCSRDVVMPGEYQASSSRWLIIGRRVWPGQ